MSGPKLVTDLVQPAFRSKRRGRSAKSVCLLHTTSVTTGTLDEMHWEVVPHPD